MTNRLHIPTVLTAALAALAVAPAAASAGTVHLVEYQVDIDATITHKHVQSYSTSYESGDRTINTSSKLHAELPQVTFETTPDGTRLIDEGGGSASAVTTGKSTAHYKNIATNQSQTCTPIGSQDPWGRASMAQDLVTPLTGDESVDVRLADDPSIGWDCTSPDIGARPEYDLSQNTEEIGGGSLDANFLVPKEAVGFGKIIQNISGPGAETTTFCPGKNDGNTKECTYSWTGTVTFVKTGETTISGGQAPSEADLPVVKGSSPVIPSSAKAAAPTAPTAAKADAKGSTVSFTAACPSGCSGTAALTVPGAGASAAKAAKPLATLRFTVKPGTHAVKLRLPKKAARALRRAHGGKLAITLKPKSGAATHRTVQVRVARR